MGHVYKNVGNHCFSGSRYVTETVHSGSIFGQVKNEDHEIGISSFNAFAENSLA